jgi:hypothetical protein
VALLIAVASIKYPGADAIKLRAHAQPGVFGDRHALVEGGFAGFTSLILAASRNHRDNIGCETPVSSSSLLAFTAFGPSIRRTIRAFTFAPYSIGRFRSRPAQLMVIRSRRQLR